MTDNQIEICACQHLKIQHEKHFGCTAVLGFLEGNCKCMEYKINQEIYAKNINEKNN